MKQQFLFWVFVFASFALKAEYNYTLAWEMPSTHTYKVSLQVEANSGQSTDFQIAVWRPGRYIRQDYAA
ncbi:MAG: hypothetical protein ACKVTZ_06300, partial [Bacteroidia bacterium]